jgi:hypothetical protein
MGASATSDSLYFGLTGIACDSGDGRVGRGNCGRWAGAAGGEEIVAKCRGFAVSSLPPALNGCPCCQPMRSVKGHFAGADGSGGTFAYSPTEIY